MESTIRKIFSGKSDPLIHNEFTKFSKGLFADRYMVEAKKQKDRWSIKTTNEFANFFVRTLLEKVHGEVEVKGVIVATFDVSKEAEFPISNIKQFMGIKQAVVESKVDPKKIITLMEKFPKAFYALSFKTADSELKIKPKAPKSAKPAAGGDKGPTIDFCSIKTTNSEIANDLLFDCFDEPEVVIKHELHINDIILPKGEKDPVKLRENAIRKGKIVRILKVGEKETRKEHAFEA
jgi:hypothetical protein